MIIACPACNTRYVVPDTAIGAGGRTVRCAKCRHSWFQDGPTPAASPPVPAAAPAPAPAPAPAASVAPASPPPPVAVPPAAIAEPAADPVPQPAEDRDFSFESQPETVPQWRHTAAQGAGDPAETSGYDNAGSDEGVSPFASEPPFQPRRNPVRTRNLIAGGVAAAALAAAAALYAFGLPSWLTFGGPTFAEPNDLVLDFPAQRQDRRTLPNGTEYFGASGTITNTGKETRKIPRILIVLRDAQERVVYTSELEPPEAELEPGETVTVNEALTDVPRSAQVAEIGWKDGE